MNAICPNCNAVNPDTTKVDADTSEPHYTGEPGIRCGACNVTSVVSDWERVLAASRRAAYNTWIAIKLSAANPWNQCAEWTTEMQSVFPELSRVRGQVVLSSGLFRDHWWLVDPSGKEVDPTATQFDSDYFGHAKVITYLPRDESEPEPTGMCPNCGGYCYNGGTCCSDACHNQYVAYCMRESGF